jgi:hypothetical protein
MTYFCNNSSKLTGSVNLNWLSYEVIALEDKGEGTKSNMISPY